MDQNPGNCCNEHLVRPLDYSKIGVPWCFTSLKGYVVAFHPHLPFHAEDRTLDLGPNLDGSKRQNLFGTFSVGSLTTSKAFKGHRTGFWPIANSLAMYMLHDSLVVKWRGYVTCFSFDEAPLFLKKPRSWKTPRHTETLRDSSLWLNQPWSIHTAKPHIGGICYSTDTAIPQPEHVIKVATPDQASRCMCFVRPPPWSEILKMTWMSSECHCFLPSFLFLASSYILYWNVIEGVSANQSPFPNPHGKDHPAAIQQLHGGVDRWLFSWHQQNMFLSTWSTTVFQPKIRKKLLDKCLSTVDRKAFFRSSLASLTGAWKLSIKLPRPHHVLHVPRNVVEDTVWISTYIEDWQMWRLFPRKLLPNSTFPQLCW